MYLPKIFLILVGAAPFITIARAQDETLRPMDTLVNATDTRPYAGDPGFHQDCRPGYVWELWHPASKAGSVASLMTTPLEGAHHRPMLSFDRMGKDSQAWATGDFGASSRTRDVHVTTGEAGLNWSLGKSALIGFAAGHAEQNEDLSVGSWNTTKGDYGLIEFDYRPEGTQWIVSLLGMVGSLDSRDGRAYGAGASASTSYGSAGVNTQSLRLRVDAPTLFKFSDFELAPFVSYTISRVEIDAHQETGGTNPLSYAAQAHNSQEGRLGLAATRELSMSTKLIFAVEAIHRFDGASPALTGQDIASGITFSIPGTVPRSNCVRFGLDVDHKLSADTLLNISIHAATIGEVQDVAGAISIRRAF
jgi:hypothetical protein